MMVQVAPLLAGTRPTHMARDTDHKYDQQ